MDFLIKMNTVEFVGTIRELWQFVEITKNFQSDTAQKFVPHSRGGDMNERSDRQLIVFFMHVIPDVFTIYVQFSPNK